MAVVFSDFFWRIAIGVGTVLVLLAIVGFRIPRRSTVRPARRASE